MLSVKINSCPYDERKLYKTSHIDLDTGLNVIIGRNGAGKSTFCFMLQKYCEDNNIKLYSYDNYKEGGSRAIESYSFYEDFDSMASTLFHSEGEQIFYNFGQQIKKIGKFIRENKEEKQLVVIFDAMDSGFDVDGIDQLKNIVDIMKKECEEYDTELYCVVTANNYALIHNSPCIDIQTGKKYEFNDFEKYRKFILDQYERDRKAFNKN